MSPILEWDKTGERTFHTGVDRGVLYLMDGTYAVWNGLVSVDSGSADMELQSFFLDGVKYLEKITPGEFSGKLKAITYPDEFEKALGIIDVSPGLEYHDQVPQPFNLTYRTLLGNDVNGTSLGYKIHLLYNLVADPETVSYDSLSDSPQLTEFVWGLTGTPPRIPGTRPTVHVALDSRDIPEEVLTILEESLYGTESTDPVFLSLADINEVFESI